MQITNTYSTFPDQVVPAAEKATYEYGLKVARAIEGEWFRNSQGYGYRYMTNYNNFHNLRLYARGEQSVQKYKDELSINGDLSYLNLDWKPVPIIPKFVDIVVNGMSQRSYEVKTMAQDPTSLKKRTEYAQRIIQDIEAAKFDALAKQEFGIDLRRSTAKNTPESVDDIPSHMQMNYKQSIEVAEEEVISQVLDKNKYDLIRRRLNYDLTVLGIGCVKTTWNFAQGIVVEYVDPANIVYSYTNDPNFEDVYYVGEVKNVPIVELKKQFPKLTPEEVKKLQNYTGNTAYSPNFNGRYDQNTVQVLYFEWKSYIDQVFKIKTTSTGLEKTLEKQDTFLEVEETDNFKKSSRSIETLYSGAKVLGMELMLDWRMAENMTRPYADTTNVNLSYTIVAPRMYQGRIESIVSRITGFADMIQLTHLKLQQVMSRMVPDGVYLDMDGLAEVDLGNGTNYNPAEALNMYFQTGSIVGRSLTQDGEINRGRVPIQELQTSSGSSKISSLISTYQYYLQMIRDVTGLNEARDASTPDPNALVGLQKLAAANSNTATRHILQSSLYLSLKTCENISLRINDSLLFPLTRMSLVNSISNFNTNTLDELMSVNMHDFGIYINLEPDEEEKQILEQNIQVALKTQSITLEDAIDIRQVNNLKLANVLLKKRREEKEKKDQELKMQQIQAQAQAQAETQEKATLAEMQKQEALTNSKVSFEQAKSQFEIQRMQTEAEIKRGLMQQEFDYNIRLSKEQSKVVREKEKQIEDRKDKRIKLQGTQQSEMITQRKQDGLPIDFESKGNDNLGGFGLGQFDPR
jgi:hypothetical protein|tara:strand:+ start:481 stop:2889 length:2409 start_codon:yes stop_codon:yes gene_type:complete